MKWFAKPGEKNYPNQMIDAPEARPRCISAFTFQWKSIMSCLAFNFTKWIKTTPFFKDKIAMGWTADDFKRKFDSELKKY